jgi:hypothetical protein
MRLDEILLDADTVAPSEADCVERAECGVSLARSTLAACSNRS